MSDDSRDTPGTWTRRGFLGTGAAVAAATTLPVRVDAAPSAPAQDGAPTGAPLTAIRFTVNGTPRDAEVEDRWTLVELLRDQLDLTGTKIGCDRGECGACTVIMDGESVYACSQLAVWANGATITTVEGLSDGDRLSPLQQAFVDHNGPQW